VNRRCDAQRPRRGGDGEIRISLEVFVRPHESVQLTAGRALIILLQELQDDRVPVHLVRVALSGAAMSQAGDGP
jgi:hypothetical protein